MSYSIIFKKAAEKQLDKIPTKFYLKIKQEILSLSDNPFPFGYKKLVDTDNEYRIRIGVYRVVYTVDTDVLIIEIIKIGHRKDIYD